MSDLKNKSIVYLQNKFPTATVLSQVNSFHDQEGNVVLKIWPMIAQDYKLGIKQRAVAIEDLGSRNELMAVAKGVVNIFSEMDSSLYVQFGNDLNKTGHSIDTNQMTFAPRLILYTNRLIASIDSVIEAFSAVNILVEVVDESKMHKTIFISYGGPDEKSVSKINNKLKSKGVNTWFFPDDSQPGQKLHRMMFEGVNNYDRVLLVCSKESLTRSGVLNEIERVLEREAKEGGTEILIPITLDDYVYKDWAPDREDIAEQVRSRVITKMELSEKKIDGSIDKLVKALKK